MAWIIVNRNDETLCWSNQHGWTDELYDTFSDEERETLNLPLEGEWRQVLWSKE